MIDRLELIERLEKAGVQLGEITKKDDIIQLMLETIEVKVNAPPAIKDITGLLSAIGSLQALYQQNNQPDTAGYLRRLVYTIRQSGLR